MDGIRVFSCAYAESKYDLVKFRNANRDSERDEKYFDWRYMERPCNLKPIIICAENKQGKRIGSMSVIPHDYWINDKICSIGVVGDISISEEWRGKGIAQRLFDYMKSIDAVRSLNVCIVLPNQDAGKALKKSGWQVVERLERYIRVLRWERWLERKKGRSRLWKLMLSPMNYWFGMKTRGMVRNVGPGFENEIIGSADERFEELWNSVDKNEMNIGVRNREYLKWRYLTHPISKYEIFGVSIGGKLFGYIAYNCSLNTCYVEDFLYKGGDEYSAYLLSSFVSHISKNENIESIVCRANRNERLRLPLRKLGFVKRPDYQEFMVYNSGEGKVNRLVKEGKWFLTLGDKDV